MTHPLRALNAGRHERGAVPTTIEELIADRESAELVIATRT